MHLLAFKPKYVELLLLICEVDAGWTNAAKAMKMIQPNCRVQFAAEDIDFILSVLGTKIGNTDGLVRLRARLRDVATQSPLFDTERFARNFQNALKTMVEERHSALGDAAH